MIRQQWVQDGQKLVANVDDVNGLRSGKNTARYLRETLNLEPEQAAYIPGGGSKGTVVVKGEAAIEAFQQAFGEVTIQKPAGRQRG